MNKPTCKQCIHFYQHYILDEQRCTSVNCGHCNYPRLKSRTPTTPACKHFALREIPPSLPSRTEIIDFLTKDMLQHICSLPLPPEVERDVDEEFDYNKEATSF